MTTLLIKGGNWCDPNTFEPSQVPTSNDDVITDVCSGDIFCDINSTCRSLKLTDYKGDIHYDVQGGSIRQSGIIRNKDRHDLFIARPDILRVD